MNRTLLLLVTLAALLSAQPKKKVTKADDLPRFTYAVNGSVTDMLTSDAAFGPLAAKVRADLESVLANYDIEDRTTLRDLQETLLALDLIENKNDDAAKRIAVVRSLEDKPAEKATSGLLVDAVLAARRDHGDDPAPYRREVYRNFAASVNSLSWDVVRDRVKQLKASAEIMSPSLLTGIVQAQMEPAARKTGGIGNDMAWALVDMREALAITIPLKDEVVEALSSYIAAHNLKKPDIWEARSVTLTPEQKATPVIMAIWDSGVDTALFRNQLVTVNGEHGIAFDLHGHSSPDLLLPLTAEQQQKYPEARNLLKGFMDLQASLDTPEASAVKQRIASLKPDEVKSFLETFNLYAFYAHGTHVAGIALKGNPFARLLVGRITFDYHIIPEPPTEELVREGVAAYHKTVDFFKANGVRVVNMSWGGSLGEVEHDLEVNGIGKTAEERRNIARKLFDMDKAGLYDALASAPDILFVAAAGNSNSNATFDEFIPSSFKLPNLLTVGAVDKAGDETSFTSFGDTVAVHANGFEVESYTPGGVQLAFSGTSMASPNVANLAGKLIALDASLKPADVIAIIKGTSERTADGRRNLINPRKAVEQLRAGEAHAGGR